MVMVFTYRIFYIHIQMRFTLFQCHGEIGHQKMAAVEVLLACFVQFVQIESTYSIQRLRTQRTCNPLLSNDAEIKVDKKPNEVIDRISRQQSQQIDM